VNAQIIRDKRIGANFLSFPASERDRFSTLIRPHVIPSMSYKLLAEAPLALCHVCKRLFTPRRNVYGTVQTRNWHLYCSAKCAKHARLRRYCDPQPVPCVICRRVFIPHCGNQKTCSSSCGRTRRLLRRREHARVFRLRVKSGEIFVPVGRICKTCGRSFTALHWNQITCSHMCSAIHERSRDKERSMELYTRARAKLDSLLDFPQLIDSAT
jgi:hypothetical protein